MFNHLHQTLSFLKKAVPCSSDFICSSYTRCLMSGLLSSRLADRHLAAPSQVGRPGAPCPLVRGRGVQRVLVGSASLQGPPGWGAQAMSKHDPV